MDGRLAHLHAGRQESEDERTALAGRILNRNRNAARARGAVLVGRDLVAKTDIDPLRLLRELARDRIEDGSAALGTRADESSSPPRFREP